MQDTQSTLKELQRLDVEIQRAEDQVRAYDPQIAEVEDPALRLEDEVGTTRSRLQEMKVDEKRVELSANEKRERVKKLDERLKGVRNVREEAAVSTELDMVKRALEGEEQEALTLLDQIRKMEDRLAEQQEALEEARAQVAPRRDELVAERDRAKEALGDMREKRDAFAAGLEKRELRLYEKIRSGGKRTAVAALTPDGACGNCFSMIPPQGQNEIKHAEGLIRCEACGVILTPPDAVPEEEEV